jgi:hypothetical protein
MCYIYIFHEGLKLFLFRCVLTPFEKCKAFAEHREQWPGFLRIHILATPFRSLYVQHLCPFFIYPPGNIFCTADCCLSTTEPSTCYWQRSTDVMHLKYEKLILFHTTLSLRLVLAIQRNSVRQGLRKFMVNFDEKLHKQLGFRLVIW